jgi:hypothetical protein
VSVSRSTRRTIQKDFYNVHPRLFDEIVDISNDPTAIAMSVSVARA